MAAKKCSKCGIAKDRTDFYESKAVYRGKRATRQYTKISSWCNDCHNSCYGKGTAYAQQRNALVRVPANYKHWDSKRKFNPLWQMCPACKQERHYSKFGIDRRRGIVRAGKCLACRARDNRSLAKARDKDWAVRIYARRKGSNPNYSAERWAARRARNVSQGLPSSGSQWQRMGEYAKRAALRGKEWWPPGLTKPPKQDLGATRAELIAASAQARKDWRWWIQSGAPDWWMREAYRSNGKPWANPRLTNGEAWRIRYWCDPEYRAQQIEKVQRTKAKRRTQIDATDDGTLIGKVIVSLFAAAKTCHYCGSHMRSVEKSLDHVIPLDRGGAHSITNVVVACKPCNFSKHTKTVEEWGGRAA